MRSAMRAVVVVIAVLMPLPSAGSFPASRRSARVLVVFSFRSRGEQL
jgi:hypothetical protein